MTTPPSWLECSRCGHREVLAALGACSVCAAGHQTGVLDVGYAAIDEPDAGGSEPALLEPERPTDPRPGGIWRWHRRLPVLQGDATTQISLDEGDTPLLRADRSVAGRDGPELWLKYEGKNPTHSFKDRFQAVAMSAAVGLGATRIVCQSTGNHGVSAAAYAARAGLQCVVLTHEEAPTAHIEAIRVFGATAVAVPPTERTPLLQRLVEAGWYPSTTHWPLPVPNPYGVEGYKTIAYEIAEQLGPERAAAASVFVPVGGGDGLYGIYKGWRDLVRLGAVKRLPRLYACQPDGAAPLVAAEAQHASDVPVVQARRSLALSIREAETGGHALRALHESGGRALAVSDAEIMDAATRLARDGLSVDPSSAAAFAGALAMLARGELQRDGPLVCVLTASGARWPVPQGWAPVGAHLAVTSADRAFRALADLSG